MEGRGRGSEGDLTMAIANDALIIGLTGSFGSGCSTLRDALRDKGFKDSDEFPEFFKGTQVSGREFSASIDVSCRSSDGCIVDIPGGVTQFADVSS